MHSSIADKIEYLAILGLLALARILGPARSSSVFGAISRRIGPLIPVSHVADRNLRAAMPEMDAATRKKTIRGVWENLGRTIGELPHLGALEFTTSGPGFELVGRENLPRQAEGPTVFIAAHFSNWEAFPPIAARAGLVASSMYRSVANPLVDQLVLGLRRAGMRADIPMFPKGSLGARRSYAHLTRGGHLGVVVDQKLNDGIAANLFGMTAMTAPAAAAFALKFRCKLIPGRIDRLGPSRLRLTLEPPIELPDSGDRVADIAAVSQTINDTLETWICADPKSWLWLHRRWPKAEIQSRMAHRHISAK